MRTLCALLFNIISGLSAVAQISGSTTIQIDPNTGIVTSTCETDLNSADNGFYAARVTCVVKDTSGNLAASGAYSDDGDRQGYALVTLTFTGVPGMTYTATGGHSAELTVPFDAPDGGQIGLYYDELNFESFSESPYTYENDYVWVGPGPEEETRRSVLLIGSTTGNAIRYYTPYELSQLITSAESLLSAQCNTDFANVIGPTYNNINFFESLRATSFIQYPPGAPNIPSHDSADAATLINQPGRPIELFPNFYPTPAGFPAGFQESILIHEGVHHYTGWLDFPDDSGTPDFKDEFYSSGYRNTSGTTNDFSVWISSGCPTAP